MKDAFFFKNRDISFFAGSGISYSSLLPSAENILKQKTGLDLDFTPNSPEE